MIKFDYSVVTKEDILEYFKYTEEGLKNLDGSDIKYTTSNFVYKVISIPKYKQVKFYLHKVVWILFGGNYEDTVKFKDKNQSNCLIENLYKQEPMPELTQALLKERWDYNPDTGIFTWKIKPTRNKNPIEIGDVAGCKYKNGYWVLSYGEKKYYAHRLVYLYMTGDWPKNLIDHIDGDRLNNRWDNIRDATFSQNHFNRVSDRELPKGVYFCKTWNKWCGRVQTYGKARVHYSESKEEVIEFVRKIREELHGEFANHG